MTDMVDISNSNSRAHVDDALSVWLLGERQRVNVGCALVNISDSGGVVIIPIDQPAPSDDFDLVVMSTERDRCVLTILQAEKLWIDVNYSATHKKMAVEFVNINTLKLQVIHSLIKMIDSRERFSLACNIVSYKPALV